MTGTHRKIVKSKKTNYPYATTRVKARKAQLIPKSQFEKFLVMEIPAITRYISESAYSKEISNLSTEYSGLDLVEAATYANLARNYREVLGFCRGHLREMVEKYLVIWDSWNLKTILRGRSYGASDEEILEDLVPAGTFSIEDLKAMLATESIDELIDSFKGTRFHRFLVEARSVSGEMDLMKLENELDRDYYISLLTIKVDSKWLTRSLDKYFRSTIDIVNLKTMFKLKYSELECDYVARFIIPGGFKLTEATLKRLAMIEDFEQFLNELKGYRFWPHIKDQAESSLETGTLNPVMSALDVYHFKEASKFGKIYPISVLPFLDYFIWKKIEVDNIRIICRGKQAGLSTELIRSMLIT